VRYSLSNPKIKILTIVFRKYPYSTFHFCFEFKMSQVRISTVIETCHGFTLFLHLNRIIVHNQVLLRIVFLLFLFPFCFLEDIPVYISPFSFCRCSLNTVKSLFSLNCEPKSKHSVEISLLFKQPVSVGCLRSCTSTEAILILCLCVSFTVSSSTCLLTRNTVHLH
jgi:hypothetical protein